MNLFKNTLIILVSGILYKNCDAQNISSQVISNFGPVALSKYSDVGSQEVIYIKIPAAYLSSFNFQWTCGILNEDSNSCPSAFVVILIRKWGLPIPNPRGSTFPDNTWINHNDTIAGSFPITQFLPNSHDQYDMWLSDPGNVTGEYYVSLFLLSQFEIPSGCNYLIQLQVNTSSPIPYEIAASTSTNYIQTLNTNEIDSDSYLERYREGLLKTHYNTQIGGYNITQNSSRKFSWMVESYSDVGGTLKIHLGFNKSELYENTTLLLRGCASWSGETLSSYNDCDDGHQLFVNTSKSTSDTWYWPFPKSGLWNLDIGIDCLAGACNWTNKINLDISIIQCIDSCQSGNSQGECKVYRTDVLFFSACDCKGGWQGLACTDGSEAVPRSKQLLETLLLTLSNIIFFPCGILAIMRGYYTESIVYFFVMFFSTFYHACDSDFAVKLCIMKYNTLQFSDFLGSITAMWVTIIAITQLPFRLESFFHVLGLMAISVAVTYDRFSVFTTLIPILCGLFILAVRWGKKCKTTHACYPAKKTWLCSVVPGMICAIVGFILFAFVENDDNYFYVHSMWHVLMGSAVLFLIPKNKKLPCQVDAESITTESDGRNGAYYNNVNSDSTGFHMELSDDSS